MLARSVPVRWLRSSASSACSQTQEGKDDESLSASWHMSRGLEHNYNILSGTGTHIRARMGTVQEGIGHTSALVRSSSTFARSAAAFSLAILAAASFAACACVSRCLIASRSACSSSSRRWMRASSRWCATLRTASLRRHSLCSSAVWCGARVEMTSEEQWHNNSNHVVHAHCRV